MKILHITPTYLPAVRYGGPIYSVHGLCRALVALGHDVHVFTTSVDGNSNSDVPLGRAVDLDGVKVWYFPSGFLRRLYFAPAMMRELRRQVASFDLLHLHSVFLWPTWAAARVARRAGVPYVLSPRGMLVRDLIRKKSRLRKTCWIRLIEKKNIEQAAMVHVTSPVEVAELKRFTFCLPGVTVVENGVSWPEKWSDNEVSEDVRNIVRNQPYLLFFGRLNWKKGIDRLLHALKEVPKLQLIVAGNDEDGYLAELKRLATTLQVSDRVFFLARSLEGADKEALFSGATLFVLSSYSENFGITVLEAMVRAVPVVITEEVGAAEIVRRSEGGIVVTAQHLGPQIASLLTDEHSLAVMGQNGKAMVEQQYSWPQMGKKMEKLYAGVLHA